MEQTTKRAHKQVFMFACMLTDIEERITEETNAFKRDGQVAHVDTITTLKHNYKVIAETVRKQTGE